MPERSKAIISNGDQLLQPTTRRRFLELLGVAGSIVFLPATFTACTDGDDLTAPRIGNYSIDLSSDAGILNYLYALAQIESAFYIVALTSSGYAQLSAAEQEVFDDLEKHEILHRELLKRMLGTAAIPALAFSAMTMASLTADRATLLRTAQSLEDTGVSAYDGAAKYLTVAVNLLVAAKIASVEARHAAAIRDIRDGTNGTLFAGDDVVNAAGLDAKAEPADALSAIAALNVVNSPIAITTSPDATRQSPSQSPLPPAIKAVLDFALVLEIFESEFYKAVLGTSASTAQNDTFATVRAALAAIPGTVPTLRQIQKHEASHVDTLLAAGATNDLKLGASSFDFTGNRGATGAGPFAAAASDPQVLLLLAQGIEDTGVRAYKGQTANLVSDPANLEAAFRIHSVEGRHASRIRRIRRIYGGADTTVRLSGTVRGGGSAAAGAGTQSSAVSAMLEKIYGPGINTTTAPSESNTTQAGVDVLTLANGGLGSDAPTEAFDEPLDRADVVAIVQPFLIPTIQ
jgi:beta-phosphoglucomutase-like phosphatase (HAD superfamily)